jgi:hypothetical protein
MFILDSPSFVAEEDPNYYYLQAGEFTKEGDEVFIENCCSSGRWEKCKNGNIDAIVSKFQADKGCYRRKVDHNFLSSLNNKITEAYLNGQVFELKQEVSTLKDQLANAMAEINELKAKASVNEKPVVQYRMLTVDDYIQKNLGDELLWHGQWSLTTWTHEKMDERSLGKYRRPIKSEYHYLKAGEEIRAGDECFNVPTGEWLPSCNVGECAGSPRTFDLGKNKPFEYRRKIS